jgi:hypothetical protein
LTTSYSQEFLRELPGEDFTKQITREKFPSSDAVIILKEQSLNMTKSTIFYGGVDFEGPAVVTAKVLIAKLLTEEGVKKYGSFEYEYYEPYGDDVPFGFEVKARVLKKDGKVSVLDKKEIKKIISLTWHDGTPLRRKVLFKIPDLAVGDIVQIEYQLDQSFSEDFGGNFLYNDKDYVIFSNAYLTLPSKAEFTVKSFPEDKVGKPVIQQMSKDLGSGKTYFWSVKNLNSIPDEPYSFPFEDQSYMTAFTVQFGWNYLDKVTDWKTLGKYFFEKVVDKGSISRGEIEDLNLPREIKNINFDKVDSLYSHLKKKFRVLDYNSIYPPKNFDELLDQKKGKATDIAFLMYKILEKWDCTANIVLIRDKRKGRYEENVPALEWFNRMGLLVTIEGKEKLYDFDPSVPITYENPWFLNSVNVFVVSKKEGYNKTISFPSTPDDNIVIEWHNLVVSPEFSINDSLVLDFSGASAENLRYKYYEKEEQDIKDNFRNLLNNSCMSKIKTLTVNDIFENSDLVITTEGKSSVIAEKVDSFLVVRLKNEIFKELKDNILTSNRRGHILFDSPFQYRYLCDIHIPRGFILKNQPGERVLNTNFKGNFRIKFIHGDNIIRVDALLNIPNNIIPQDKYKELIGLLDNAIKAIEKDIVLKKVM